VNTVIIGLGNPVRTDDGVGLAVARCLRDQLAGTDGVTVEELWAGGLRLVEAMSGYDRAVLVDALHTGDQPAGTVRRLSLSDLGGARTTTCVHDTSLPTALEIWRRLGAPLPQEISVWGIEAQDLDSFSEELTASVAQAVPRAAAAILDHLQLCKGA
jgi:hydrogenase maturation protease